MDYQLKQRLSMSEQQRQFTKNTNAPAADSVLWQLGDGWKISKEKGNIYTALKNIDHDDLRTQLKNQKNTKQLVQIGDYYFVCKAFQDGNLSAYAYDLTQKAKAEQDLGYAVKALLAMDSANNNVEPQQTLTTASLGTVPTTTSNSTTITAPSIPPPQVSNKMSQVIEVPYDLQQIEWDDAMGIESATQDGLIPLPVKFVGVENWGFIGNEGKRTFWYGRIKLVRIAEE